ncbi:MAG: DNA phosphorothioation-associated protein 4 [Cyanobacteria bacterium P01_D01_bin.44]
MDIRIRIASDKVDIVKNLKEGTDVSGPFKTYADALVFAATLGASYRKRLPIDEVSDIAPIRQDAFNQNFGVITGLLAVVEDENPKTLSQEDALEEERIKIFEEYANSGLEILKESLKGSIDYSEKLLLILKGKQNKDENKKSNDLSLSDFLHRT